MVEWRWMGCVWGTLPSALYWPVLSTRHWVVGEGAGQVWMWFLFFAPRTNMFQTDIVYSRSTIFEKLKVSYKVFSIVEKKIFSAEFSKTGGLLKF